MALVTWLDPLSEMVGVSFILNVAKLLSVMVYWQRNARTRSYLSLDAPEKDVQLNHQRVIVS